MRARAAGVVIRVLVCWCVGLKAVCVYEFVVYGQWEVLSKKKVR